MTSQESISDRDKIQNYGVLVDSVRKYIKLEERDLHTLAQKLNLLTENQLYRVGMIDYEMKFAQILAMMMLRNDIKNFYPVPANSDLDRMKVDFIVESIPDMFVPFQITSKYNKLLGKGINGFYPKFDNKHAIATIFLVDRISKTLSSDDVLMSKVIQKINTTRAIWVPR